MWRLSGVTPIQPSIKRKLPAKLKKKTAREPNELTSRKVWIFKHAWPVVSYGIIEKLQG